MEELNKERILMGTKDASDIKIVVGKSLKEFSITLAKAVLLSGFIALILFRGCF